MEQREGTVCEFDEHQGLGKVRATGGREYGFHCTQIADGSRTIAVGDEITFRVGPGGRGRWEAFDLQAHTWVCPACGARNDGEPRSNETCAECETEDDPARSGDAAV